PLRVLELLARAGLPVLLALAHARVAREQAGLLQRRTKLFVEARERAREAVSNGSGLPRRTATADRREDVELPRRLRDLERLRDDHAQGLTREVVFEGAAVDDDAASARLDPDPRDRS